MENLKNELREAYIPIQFFEFLKLESFLQKYFLIALTRLRFPSDVFDNEDQYREHVGVVVPIVSSYENAHACVRMTLGMDEERLTKALQILIEHLFPTYRHLLSINSLSDFEKVYPDYAMRSALEQAENFLKEL